MKISRALTEVVAKQHKDHLASHIMQEVGVHWT